MRGRRQRHHASISRAPPALRAAPRRDRGGARRRNHHVRRRATELRAAATAHARRRRPRSRRFATKCPSCTPSSTCCYGSTIDLTTDSGFVIAGTCSSSSRSRARHGRRRARGSRRGPPRGDEATRSRGCSSRNRLDSTYGPGSARPRGARSRTTRRKSSSSGAGFPGKVPAIRHARRVRSRLPRRRRAEVARAASGTGFDDAELRRLQSLLAEQERPTSPLLPRARSSRRCAGSRPSSSQM